MHLFCNSPVRLEIREGRQLQRVRHRLRHRGLHLGVAHKAGVDRVPSGMHAPAGVPAIIVIGLSIAGMYIQSKQHHSTYHSGSARSSFTYLELQNNWPFLIQKHHLSGVILHCFCIFNRKVGIYIAIRRITVQPARCTHPRPWSLPSCFLFSL